LAHIHSGEDAMAKPKTPVEELRGFPGMVRWFNPPLLLDTARQAIASALFGQYADRRLIQAALDTSGDNQCAARADLSKTIQPRADGNVWVDFVADLGDGFDSTYAIAYLLSRPELDIRDAGKLPRGQVLIMGGDQVYPTATHEEYDRRMKAPYAAAFPDSKAPGTDHPLLFLIPGNHDWYDGLVLFLAKFCRGRDTPLGSWRATQHRSYFAIQLPDNWWIWGIDTQLTEDIDQPQASYFVAVARSMPGDAKIILVCGVPSWLKAEESADDDEGKREFYRSLDYVAGIARNEARNATICAVLSGDTHHYSRYSADEAGTQFITAGGGGAFLHPTHQLKDEIKATWVRKTQMLSLKTEPGADHKPSQTAACYPSKEQSRDLLRGNRKFVFTNPEFCLTLGAIYWVAYLLLNFGQTDLLAAAMFEGSRAGADAFWRWPARIACNVLANPMFVVVAGALGWALCKYADEKTTAKKLRMGLPHAVVHLALVVFLTSVLPPLNAAVFGLAPAGSLAFWLTAVEFVVVGGFAGGLIWGAYLSLVCGKDGLHYNDAFSAMRLDSYRHFLRMRIKGDELTIYPIGVDKAPARDDWTVNANAAKNNQNEAVYLPSKPLGEHLIEGPVVIRARRVQSVEEVSKSG
jgi:hypothetical protein